MRRASLAVALIAACTVKEDPLVVRTISEYDGEPMPGVLVQVDEQPWTATDAKGEARFSAARATFTVRIHQSYGSATYQADKIWELRGRTGKQVVAIVDGSPAPHHLGRITGVVTGRAGAPASAVWVWLSGGATGMGHGGEALAAPDGTFALDVQWDGPAAATLTLRALESDGGSPPGHYLGYGETPVALADAGGGARLAGVAIALAPVAEQVVPTTIATPAALAGAQAELRAGAVFGEFDYRWIGAGPLAAPALPVVVPSLPGAARWAGVRAGTAPGAEHARRVAAAGAIALDLPAPVELLEPADGASTAPAATSFLWSAGPAGGRCALVLYCEWSEGGVSRVVGYRGVESDGNAARLPAVPGVSIAPGAACRWVVAWQADADPTAESRSSWSAERTLTAAP